MALKSLKTDTLNTVGDVNGLVHIETVSFSAVASQSFNDVFSSTYENYKIIANVFASTDTALTIRYRVSGSDATGANYDSQRVEFAGTTSSIVRVTGGTSVQFASVRATNSANINCDIFQPFLTKRTGLISSNMRPVSNIELILAAADHQLTNSYDGFTFTPLTGTITGTVRIYGLQD